MGYMDKRLDERLKERLDELGYHPFKADSKIQPNICATMIIGGNHERTTEMAFGNQLDDLARNVGNVKRVIVPFRNHLPDFTAPKITEMPPTFGREKWLDKQNKHIAIQTKMSRAIDADA